ncbi:MAG: OsmC family protein [Candidatus Nanopelagicales bacterium]
MAREIVVTSQGGDAYDMEIKGHVVRVDQPERAGGTDTGPSPTDLWVASLGGCVAYYAGKYLREHDLPTDVTVRTRYKVALGPTRVSRIEVDVEAPQLPEEQRPAFDEEIRHCLVHNSLHEPPAVEITTLTEQVATSA